MPDQIEKLKRLRDIFDNNEIKNGDPKKSVVILDEKLGRLKEDFIDYKETNEEEHFELYKSIENITLIPGEKGDKGDKGDKGERGNDGVNGINGKNGLNGVDGLNGIDGKDGVDGKDGKDADLSLIKLPEVDKSDIEKLELELKELKEELEVVKNIKVRGGGGGTSAIGVAYAFKHIAHTEQPAGTIDGVNKTFTVSNNIFWIAGFTINNQQIAELPNFTYVGKTITFASAIPAVFSGKDFEVKYIGT